MELTSTVSTINGLGPARVKILNEKDIFTWWYSKRNQKIIKKLQINYANVNNNPLTAFANTLLKI